MMSKKILSRREFLNLSGFSLGGLALASLPGEWWDNDSKSSQLLSTKLDSKIITPFPNRTEEQDYGRLMRVAIHEVDLRALPSDKGEIVGKRYRDQLVHVYYDLEPADAPAYYNKLWYRVWGGYLHSSYLQPVEIRFNKPFTTIRKEGQLCEVTVPYTQSYRYEQGIGWQVEYRLYFGTTHWVTGIEIGPDGQAWYRITDELQPWEYMVPAHHLRPIPDEEFAPLSPNVPWEAKRIDVDLARQTLTAYESNREVLKTRISSGIPSSTPTDNGIPTDTPKGHFNIYSKMPSKHMGDGSLMRGDLNLDAYELVGVPWTSFFHKPETGYAFHGTYWHNNFGWQMSHGCVNMHNEDAKWLFRWTTPVSKSTDVESRGYGTQVHVF
jgi:lipoprotein-anchoring transpeptidase ErfK/SrfK